MSDLPYIIQHKKNPYTMNQISLEIIYDMYGFIDYLDEITIDYDNIFYYNSPTILKSRVLHLVNFYDPYFNVSIMSNYCISNIKRELEYTYGSLPTHRNIWDLLLKIIEEYSEYESVIPAIVYIFQMYY
jgi:hypothetical protein